MKSAALLLLLSGQAAADRAKPFTVTGSPEEGLQFAVERYPSTGMPDVEAMILADANRRCSPKIARYNSYSFSEGGISFNGTTVSGVLHYRRLMLCVDPVARGALAPKDFTPSIDDNAAALRAFTDYFAAFDAQRVDMVQRLSDGPPTPDARVAEMMRSINADVGIVKRIPQEVHWVANAPDQSRNGSYVDIRYYQALPDHVTLCGTALFYRVDAKTYRLSRNMMQRTRTPTDKKSEPCTLYRAAGGTNAAVKP